MKDDLQALRSAGQTRLRFSAKVCYQDRRGCIILRNVWSPTGRTEHAWIRPNEWHGPIPKRGRNVEFLATICPYYKGDGEEDYGLFDLKVIP